MGCWLGLGHVTITVGERAGWSGEPGERARAEECLARGTRLFGAWERRREATGEVIWSPARADYERCVAVARAGLGEEAFVAAWAEGRAMTLEETLALAWEC